MFKRIYVPHDDSSFATFSVYDRKPGWNEYSANVRDIFYTEKIVDGSFMDLRVMDGDSFVVETRYQKRLSKYTLAERLALPEREQRKIIHS